MIPIFSPFFSAAEAEDFAFLEKASLFLNLFALPGRTRPCCCTSRIGCNKKPLGDAKGFWVKSAAVRELEAEGEKLCPAGGISIHQGAEPDLMSDA